MHNSGISIFFYQRALITEDIWQQVTEEERALFKIKLFSKQQKKQQRYVFIAALIVIIMAIIYFAPF
ncbi:hypothetical protein [Loigolactobacillus zhaoyuanensis]|uniref:Uncharacterized protein n=1 Tax=Loigolactobacillus zhaoyuanensis TaxID=2486017 RepID=A0ABW8UGF6_9LACO